MKEDIKHLQQMTRRNTYPASNGNYRSFRTTDGLLICRRCNQVGHLHAHAQETYHLQEHPHITRITNTTMSLLASPNIHGRPTFPSAPTINIINVLPIDHTSINGILEDILTRRMPPIPVPHDDHSFHPPIKPAISTKLEGLTF